MFGKDTLIKLSGSHIKENRKVGRAFVEKKGLTERGTGAGEDWGD